MTTRPRRSLVRRFAFIAALLGLFTIVLGVGAAQAAIPDSDISQDWVHSTAYRVGNGDDLRFYGALQAHNMAHTSVDGCYEVQQLTPGGTWTEAGFSQAQTGDPVNPMIHCNYWPATNSLWRINDGLSVRGIRFVKLSGNGSSVGTHCNTATSCRNMYQGT